jgi:hypothetical protein
MFVSWLFRYGMREDLLVELNAIVSRTNADGAPLLAHNDGQKFVRAISLRNYASITYELSHLVGAVQQLKADGALSFFWMNESFSPASVRAWFEQALVEVSANNASAVNLSSDFIQLSYLDGDFAISPTRVPVLATMMEWLVGIVGFEELQQHFDALAQQPSISSARTTANEWQRKIYAYLDDKLAPQDELRHFGRLQAWLSEQDQSHEQQITDQAVLNYWLHYVNSASNDYREYRTVFEICVCALQAIAAGNKASAIAGAATVGSDVDNGEIHPDWVDAAVEALSDEYSPTLDVLAINNGTDTKFVTAKVLDKIKPLLATNGAWQQLPLSYLRDQVFGWQQSRVSNALRRSDSSAINSLVNCVDTPDYQQHMKSVVEYIEPIEQAQLAVLYLLLEAQSIAGVAALRERLPTLDLWPQLFKQDTEEGELAVLVATFYRQFKQHLMANPPLRQLHEQARTAWKQNNRTGFKQAPQINDERSASFSHADQALAHVVIAINTFTTKINQQTTENGDLEQFFSSDLSIFKQSFEILYGEHK